MSEQALWIAGAVFVVSFAVVLGLLARKLLVKPSDAVTANTRVARQYYKPMTRLLSEGDFRDLVVLGFTPRQIEQLRASRRRVFRQYLMDLQADFRGLHYEARLLLRDSSVDRPDLAVELVKQQFAFQTVLALAHCRLAMHALGLPPVDVRDALESIQRLHQQVELLRAPGLNAA